ncbi:TonB-dependent receptor [Flavitalea sp. BT771]|uniref:SusC/RagA family TonB-linked outer membrane protein n=1 Tax=Flavitalea sp. BT771 TaxID=3063329 RepID=UPI0026E3A0D3|nr:TonB-dependent receptor [Flavitalea sp. BT771]MDO6429343.1 TonB-dependent receptor [Flavitalea sp. BT771]MDV6218529.1 TonB-dependent receptor [Flavitalea sp. BT771]
MQRISNTWKAFAPACRIRICILLVSLPSFLLAQTRTISGTVRDEKGQPMAGASATVKKTGIGTSTDAAGKFSLQAATGAVIVLSAVNYEDVEIVVGQDASYNVVFKQKASQLNDVVVVGYGTQKKADLTGAIATVDKRLLENRPVTNAVAALQGAAPGLIITRFSGQPGKEDYAANVRGYSSVNGTNTALVLVDGVEGDLALLNPNDIESISVLKDAAAVSIYGAKAAGGAILVTTKKGTADRLTVTYSGLTTFNHKFGIPQRLHSWQDAEMQNEAFKNAGFNPAYTQQELDWMKDPNINYIVNPSNPSVYKYYYDLNQINLLMRKTAFSQTHNVSLRGGSDKTQYLFSVGYFDQDGVFKFGPDGTKRYNARLNLTTKLSNIFSLDARVAYTQTHTMSPSGDTYADYGLLYGIYQLRTIYPVFLPGSNETKYARAGSAPTTYQILKDGGYNEDLRHNLDGVFTLKAENFVKGLSVRLLYSPQLTFAENNMFEKTIPLYDIGPEPTKFIFNPNSFTKFRGVLDRTNVQALADYDLEIADRHHFHLLGGYQYQYFHADTTSATASALISNDVPSLNLSGDPTVPPTVGDNVQANALVSYFGRFNYNFDGKYFVEATLRNDASSQLAPSRRSQYFPSVSAAWRLAKEGWFRDAAPFFDELKIRGSWGKLGNSNVLGNYDYISMLNRGPVYPFNNTRNNSLYQAVLASPEKTWERIATTDGGIDIGLLQSRLTASFDYYVRTNENMLVVVNVPSTLGLIPSATNSARLRTRGWEASIGWKDRTRKLNYWINFNISDNKDVVTRYDGQNVIAEGLNTVIQGMPINSIYGYESQGYFKTDADVAAHAFQDSRTGAGDLIYKDQDKNGVVNGGLNRPDDHGDLVYLGNTSPRFTFGLNLGAEWNGFDLSALFQGVGKRNMLIYPSAVVPFVDAWRQPWAINTDYWTPTHTDALFPRLYVGGTQNVLTSTKWVQNAAYIRLKNLQVGYTLPQRWTSKAKIQKARIFFSGQDIWEHSKMWYKYFDAESPNNAAYNYPFFRSYAAGLNITF